MSSLHLHTECPTQKQYEDCVGVCTYHVLETSHRQQTYADLRLSVNRRWAGMADLGRSSGSKTWVSDHVGDSRAEPDQVVLALKAWMIYRWQFNDGRFLVRPCRLRAWQWEVNCLRREIASRGGAEALHPLTRERLWEWAPHTLA